MPAVIRYPLSHLLCNFKFSESSSMCEKGPWLWLSMIRLPVSTPASHPSPQSWCINLLPLRPLCFCQSELHWGGNLFQGRGLQNKPQEGFPFLGDRVMWTKAGMGSSRSCNVRTESEASKLGLFHVDTFTASSPLRFASQTCIGSSCGFCQLWWEMLWAGRGMNFFAGSFFAQEMGQRGKRGEHSVTPQSQTSGCEARPVAAKPASDEKRRMPKLVGTSGEEGWGCPHRWAVLAPTLGALQGCCAAAPGSHCQSLSGQAVCGLKMQLDLRNNQDHQLGVQRNASKPGLGCAQSDHQRLSIRLGKGI